jgi:hypothetical protein
VRLHESSVGALVDEHALVADHLDAGVETRDQVPLDDHVALVGATDHHRGPFLVEHRLDPLELQAQARACARLRRTERDLGQHAGRVIGLPEHFVERDLAALALDGGDVDLPDRRPAIRRKLRHGGRSGDDLPGLGLTGHAVRRMDGGAEHVPALEHHRPEVAADADGDRDAVGAQP